MICKNAHRDSVRDQMIKKILPIVVFAAVISCSCLIYAAPGKSASIQAQVKVLYREGVVLYRTGKLIEAKEKFRDILEIAPGYEPARSKLRLILDVQSRMLRRDRVNANSARMLEVEQKWAPPARAGMAAEEEISYARFKTEQQKMMEEKAQQVIPEINFTDAHLRDVLQYLSRVSGVNIILDEAVLVQQQAGELGIVQKIEVTGGTENIMEEEVIGPAPEAPAVISDRVTISLKSIPLIEALKYILTAKGLKYRIDEYAIIVSSTQNLEEEEMETRYYHLASGIGSFTEYLGDTEETEDVFAWEGDEEEEGAGTTMTIKNVLEESGIPFPPGSKIFLDQRTGTLIVRNTPSNLNVVEDILRILDVTPYQIEIEARFVLVTADTAEELGFEWMIKSRNLMLNNQVVVDNKTTDSVYGRYPDPNNETGYEGISKGLRYLTGSDFTPGQDKEINRLINFASSAVGNPLGDILSLSGILTQPQFRVILHALNETGDANLVSSPKVTTLNNQRAQIEMVEEFIYPEEYEVTPPTIRSTSVIETRVDGNIMTESTRSLSSKIVTPGIAVPISFETRNIGVILNVTPSVGSDKKTITLTLIPEISEFLQWIDYGISEGAGWNAVPIVKPIFQTRNVTTSVVIGDGETVVLGGLVKEEIEKSEDKIPILGDIPLLGRLFRSKRNVTKKTNLIIFVTARLLTPSGELIREDKEYGQQGI